MAYTTFLNVTDLIRHRQQARVLTLLRATAHAVAKSHCIHYLIPQNTDKFEQWHRKKWQQQQWHNDRIQRMIEHSLEEEEEDYNNELDHGDDDDGGDGGSCNEMKRFKTTVAHSSSKSSKKAKYQGAVVINPICGFYTYPILVFDFESLYPSIMLANNICFTTYISPDKYERLAANDIKMHRCLNNTFFVSEPTGLIPLMLRNLLASRSEMKEKMKQLDPLSLEYKVLDKIQQTKKIMANSVYGFTGCENVEIFNINVAQAVTAYGQKLLIGVKEDLENNYTKNIESDATLTARAYKMKIVYGDTDSVFVSVKPIVNGQVTESVSTNEAFIVGHDITKYLNTRFRGHFKIAFEKVFTVLILLSKKKYLGLK